jgi:hypothetical protein
MTCQSLTPSSCPTASLICSMPVRVRIAAA